METSNVLLWDNIVFLTFEIKWWFMTHGIKMYRNILISINVNFIFMHLKKCSGKKNVKTEHL